ncbi:diguanylate cyclase domain-containing protein [Cupriavidus basilensis]
MLLDIDHFKQLNDAPATWPATKHSRHSPRWWCSTPCTFTPGRGEPRQCLVGRYGGEEFGVLLSSANLTQAVEMAERLSRALQPLRPAWRSPRCGATPPAWAWLAFDTCSKAIRSG